MKSCTISEEYTLKEVMMSFEENNERAAIVINKKNLVTGIISQGDIVKALVRGVGIHTMVKQIVKPSYLYLKERNLEQAYRIFKEKGISLLPVIGNNSELISVITLYDIFEYLENRRHE